MDKLSFDGLSPEVTAYIDALEQRVDQLTEIVQKLQKTQFGSSGEKAK